MARLFILLFVSFFSFSSYSSDFIRTQWFNTCAIHHDVDTDLFLERVSSIEECHPFLPKSDRYPVCASDSIYLASGIYACTHKEYGWPILLGELRPYKGCPEGYEKISEYYCEVSSTPEPEPPSCDDPDLQKEIQHAQHACTLSMPETEFFANVFKWWCENGDVYTYCGHEPKNCIQGLTCSKPDDDVPVCNPDKQECELPEPDPDTPGTPETPIPDIEIEKPEKPPEDFCKQFPDQCLEPELPEDPDLPNPDPDVPNEPDETANNLLENIHATLDSFRTNSMLDNDKDGRWQQHMLGQVRALLKTLEEGIKVEGGGGGGGSEAGIAAVGDKLGDKLDEIKCELAEDCEGEEKEKPTAKVDCEQSIFECKGDVIQCVLLKMEFESSCPTGELGDLEEEMKKLFGPDRTGDLIDTETIDFSKMDSKYLSNGVSFGNAGCPTPESSTISHFTGSTTIEISFEPACHYARIAAPIHVILAWVAGLLLIGRTQGAF